MKHSSLRSHFQTKYSSVSRHSEFAVWTTWYHSEISMGKSFACKLQGFLLKWLDFTCENSPNNGKYNCTLTWTWNIPWIIVKQKVMTDFEVSTQAAPLWTWSGPLRATWMAVWASVFWAFNASMVSLNSASSDSYNKHSYIEYKHNRLPLIA